MKKILILTTVLFAMLFAGCNREIIDPEDNLKGDATISVQISGYAATKALDTVTANIKVKKLRVILVNAVGNIAANKYVENADGVTAIENIVVPVGTYTFLAIANETPADTAALKNATKLSDIKNIATFNLAGEYLDAEAVMLTGYMEGVSLVKGINYLGYGPNPVGVPATATILDQDFVLYRLVSMIHMGKISNNTDGKLTIDSIFVVNAKKATKLFPGDLSSAGNRTRVKHNIAHYAALGQVKRDTTFAQGSLSNLSGGFRYPRFYGGGNAADSMKLHADDLLAVDNNLSQTLNWAAGAGANVNKSFYVYSNDGFTAATNDSTATMLVIRGSWKETPSSAAVPTYYPIVINKAKENYTLTGSGTNLYVQRNSMYRITEVKIANKGLDNLWTGEVSSLNVNMTVGDWDAIIGQTVEF
jgi:hypothetical protein